METDRNGNQVAYDFDASQMLVHKQVYATRNKSSLEPRPWGTWMSYNAHNQRLLVVNSEGDSAAFAYEDETNTITFPIVRGVPYGRRIGLLKNVTRLPGNTLGIAIRAGSNGQTQLSQTYFYDPVYNQLCATVKVQKPAV